MTPSLPMLAIGLGCRRGCPAGPVVDLVEAVRRQAGATASVRLFTVEDKADEAGLREAAASLGLTLTPLRREALEAVMGRVLNRSAAAQRALGLASVSEAAALAGAGPGARLIVPRIVIGAATAAAAALAEDLP